MKNKKYRRKHKNDCDLTDTDLQAPFFATTNGIIYDQKNNKILIVAGEYLHQFNNKGRKSIIIALQSALNLAWNIQRNHTLCRIKRVENNLYKLAFNLANKIHNNKEVDNKEIWSAIANCAQEMTTMRMDAEKWPPE